MLITQENKEKLPFKYFSPSSIIEFLTNEKSFFEKYIKYNWSEKTWPALIIGTAYHSALEFYYQSIIDNKKDPKQLIKTDSEVINEALNSITKNFSYYEKRGLEKLIDTKNYELHKKADWKDFIKINFEKWYEKYLFLLSADIGAIEYIQSELDIYELELKKMEEKSDNIEELKKDNINYSKIMADINSNKKILAQLQDPITRAEFTVYKNGFITLEEIEDYKNYFIDFWKTGSKSKAQADLLIAVNNYLENKPDDIDPIEVEANHTWLFSDFEWVEMPLGIKWKMDLLARNKKGELIIIDHKCVSAFWQKNGAYELQASAYYFVTQALMGEKPKKMIFNECIKKSLSASKGYLKKDLVLLCEQNQLEAGWKVEDLQIRLIDAWILKNPSPINPIIIDFEEEPEIIQAFIEIYKQILNRSFYYFIDKQFKFIPNIKADYTGESSWADFKKETVNEQDIIQEYEAKFTLDDVELDL